MDGSIDCVIVVRYKPVITLSSCPAGNRK